MPYKTRRQKIAALQRRYIHAKTLSSGAYVYAGEKSERAQKHQSTIETADDMGNLKRDIFKIVIISSIILFAQTCIRLTLF